MNWALIEQEAKERIETLRAKLEGAKPEDVRFIQGEIAGLRWIINTPVRLSQDPSRMISPPTSGY